MAVFTQEDFDWRRPDVTAIVSYSGLVTTPLEERAACARWLRREGYHLVTLDCSNDFSQIVTDLAVLLHWREQFGYDYGARGPSLNALNDGFCFEVPEQGGLVLELLRPDLLWEQEPQWLIGMLTIAQEHTRYHLAFGRRFFTLLVMPTDAPLIGQTLGWDRVPGPYHPITG